eukprot:TRINITY_DN17558_c0_g1_i1.p2 TRINITY_DN17558_c0_g1~~TRINITY_DN17558_c0_g1_i1.p2  ORF type:complete len:141 (+),score=6.29 TRINITY_DN17558_c0_g1_i1:709-1131(+)
MTGFCSDGSYLIARSAATLQEGHSTLCTGAALPLAHAAAASVAAPQGWDCGNCVRDKHRAGGSCRAQVLDKGQGLGKASISIECSVVGPGMIVSADMSSCVNLSGNFAPDIGALTVVLCKHNSDKQLLLGDCAHVALHSA